MATVEMYYKPGCPFCIRAKKLLESKGASITEMNAYADPDHRAEMIQRSNGGRTYPQIFIDSAHVGGSDDLARLEALGKLDPMLAA